MMGFLKKIYPFFFAIFPVLFYYNSNRFETTISSIFLPLALSCVIYAVVYGVLRLIVKDKERLKLVLALFIFYFFSYKHFANALPWLKDFISYVRLPVNYVTFALYTLILIGIGRILLRYKNRGKLAGALAILGIYLTIFPLSQIIPWELSRASSSKTSEDIAVDKKTINNVTNKPDIYYLILDRYANDATLRDYYNFDNSEFLSGLKERGFFIANQSYANFPKTHLSLASSLNLEYINYLTDTLGKDHRDYTPAFRLVQDNKVVRILKSLGYRYIYFGDWWEPTRINPYADENINLYSTSNEFLRKFFSTTAVYPLVGGYLQKIDFLGFSDERVYQNLVYKFDQLETVAVKKSPKFVFAHMLMPHYPYVFDENCRKSEDGTGAQEKPKYIAQLKCTNSKMMEVIDGILANSKTPPIIIVQSDEGPFDIDEMNRSGEGVDWTKVSAKAIKTHMRILNTYYIPGEDGKPIDYKESGFKKDTTPVNSFRLLFNTIFDSNLKILEDKSYFIPHLDKPYDYIDKTDMVKFGNE